MVSMRMGLLAVAIAGAAANAQTTVYVDQSDATWLGFMNVFELPENGGGFVFGSGWGVPDLVATFDDPNNELTLSPNTVGDPNEFWYQEAPGGDPGDPNNGGPGAPGNKLMEANLYQEVTDSLAGQMVTFEGNILSDSTTDAHMGRIFIKDFAPDYSSFNETVVDITGPGAFSISLMTDAGPGRHVQWGFQFIGENVWVTDVAPFGNIVIETIPTPASAALLGLGGLVASRRRRA
ncbi:MAG: hypothetical protein ACF8Q5_04315 [Phycisphaerales bacterium JB040]